MKTSILWRRFSLVVVLSGLSLWEVTGRAGWISGLFFPPPSVVGATLIKMTLEGDLWFSLGLTLYRLALGVVIGGTAGLLLGWAMGASRSVQVALDPLVAVLHPLPKVAIFPIFLILLGIGESSKIAVVALAAFFPLLLNTVAGVRQIDRAYWEMANNYGASLSRIVLRLLLPGSLPMVLTGLRLAVNNALIVTIAIEMLSARQGLGASVWLAWQTLRVDELYAILLVIALVGLGISRLIFIATEKLLPWLAENNQY